MSHETDRYNVRILQLITQACIERDDEDAVKEVIDAHLATWPEALRATMLAIALRVMIAQFFATTAAKLDAELGYPMVDNGLDYQEGANMAQAAVLGCSPPTPVRPGAALCSSQRSPRAPVPHGDADHARN